MARSQLKSAVDHKFPFQNPGSGFPLYLFLITPPLRKMVNS